MDDLIFEWNEEKSAENLKKHNVPFEEAKSIFNDPFLLTCFDPEHSQTENRFLSVGFSIKNRILIVCHTDRDDNIRIISCRKATRKETLDYTVK